MMGKDEINRVCSSKDGAWGLHIIALFHSVNVHKPEMPFIEHKDTFFWLLEKLLHEGKIAFDDPYGEPWTYNPYSTDPDRPRQDEAHLWKAKPEEIVDYLRARWPSDASQENDLELNYYFYEIPYILWRGEDGKWYGS